MAALKRWREGYSPVVEYGDLARRLSCHPDQLRHFEAGRRALPIPVAIPLHHITGIPVDDLLTRRQARVWSRMAPQPSAPETALNGDGAAA